MITVMEIVDRLAKKAKPEYREAFAKGDKLLSEHGITTPLRVAHFLAQVFHETSALTIISESLRYTTAERLMEIFGVGNHSAAIRPEEVNGLLRNAEALAERVYGLGNPRKAQELGNIEPGDGFKYRGRGVLQTTGRGNYKKLGAKAKIDFEGKPELVSSAKFALISPLLEWSAGRLNSFADRNDIRTITKTINGGFNGFEDRKDWFAKIFPLVQPGVTVSGVADSGLSPSAERRIPVEEREAMRVARVDPRIKQLQIDLNDLGADPVLKVDGRFGPETERTVKEFQEIAGLPVDGIPDEVTLAAIKLRLRTLR